MGRSNHKGPLTQLHNGMVLNYGYWSELSLCSALILSLTLCILTARLWRHHIPRLLLTYSTLLWPRTSLPWWWMVSSWVHWLPTPLRWPHLHPFENSSWFMNNLSHINSRINDSGSDMDRPRNIKPGWPLNFKRDGWWWSIISRFDSNWIADLTDVFGGDLWLKKDGYKTSSNSKTTKTIALRCQWPHIAIYKSLRRQLKFKFIRKTPIRTSKSNLGHIFCIAQYVVILIEIISRWLF